MSTTEFAPEYTTAERIRFAVLGIVAGAVLVAGCQLWFFPWLREFAASAQCRSVFGVKGTAVLFYGVFVGIPLQAAVVLAAVAGRRGYMILREGRVPPSGEKVFRRTRIQRGARAKLSGYMQLFSAAPLLALAVWGSSQAGSLHAQAEAGRRECGPDRSIERTAADALRSPVSAGHFKR